MQQGDLEYSVRPRTVIVLEGVLCGVVPIERKRRLREPQVTGYHIGWYDVPLKRLVYLKERWPETSMEIVTFVSQELLDDCLPFLDEARIPYDRTFFTKLDMFCSTLRYQADLRAVYDSDPARLDRYGQYGVSVTRGMDW